MKALQLLNGGQESGVVAPEGVSFDGVTDYLSRSTDLVGNVDSKTFTFSCWVYTTITEPFIISIGGASRKFSLNLEESGVGVRIRLTALNSSNTTILSVTDSNILPLNTFVHISISIDLTSTLKRHIYVNDISRTGLSWNAYTNSAIDFATSTFPITIGAYSDGSGFKLKGRLSNLFLYYTYRDLSIEANRRLFITADGKPTPTATLKALNPILYLPMKDAATAHINEGTGGNFTLNGTIATSERGANQDNCVASYFDGTADYLSRAGVNIIGTDFTLALTINQPNITDTNAQIITFGTNSANEVYLYRADSGADLKLTGWLSSAIRFSYTLLGLKTAKKNDHLVISVSNTGGYYSVNGGQPIALSAQTFSMSFPTAIFGVHYSIANGTVRGSGTVGELYFDTKYIDLATNNPFWDSETNKPLPVRKVIANTGVTPLVAMPLDASNAGKNYGTGGDFTANSAPYVGARGASEFWARSMSGDGTTGYLKRTSLAGLVSSKTFSFMCCGYMDTSASDTIISIQMAGGTPNNFRILTGASTPNNIDIIGSNSAGAIILNDTYVGVVTTATWFKLFVSVDLSVGILTVNINGTTVANTAPTLTNDFLNFTNASAIYMGAEEYSSIVRQWWQGDLSCMYFTTDYIDFSQEANRNLFVNQLGYPRDLKPLIEDGTIPNPLIYLPFDDTSNLGKNYGTGGDFTVNGTVTAGADFSI